MADYDSANKKPSAVIFWLIVGGVVVLLVLIAFAGYVVGPRAYSIFAEEYTAADHKWSFLGTVGDSFGAMNALFSGAALIGIVIALIYQRRELGGQLETLTKHLHWTSQAEILKTTRELVLVGLSNEEFTSWMTDHNWSRRDQYIHLWINAFFLSWQAKDLELEWGPDYWEGTVKEMKGFFGYEATRTWWSQAKQYYPDPFVNKIDSMMGDCVVVETHEDAASTPQNPSTTP